MQRFLGHLTWCGLVRREVLSIFSAVYVFARLPERLYKIWDSVARELFWASSLLPLWFSDSRLPWSPEIYATDAEGAGDGHFGG